MNSLMLKKCADIFIESGYAGSKSVRIKSNTLCVLTHEGRTVEVDPFGGSLDSRKQLDVLEKHYRIQTQQNEQGDVNVSDLRGTIKSGGGCPRYGRMSVVEMCLRHDANEQS